VQADEEDPKPCDARQCGGTGVRRVPADSGRDSDPRIHLGLRVRRTDGGGQGHHRRGKGGGFCGAVGGSPEIRAPADCRHPGGIDLRRWQAPIRTVAAMTDRRVPVPRFSGFWSVPGASGPPPGFCPGSGGLPHA